MWKYSNLDYRLHPICSSILPWCLPHERRGSNQAEQVRKEWNSSCSCVLQRPMESIDSYMHPSDTECNVNLLAAHVQGNVDDHISSNLLSSYSQSMNVQYMFHKAGLGAQHCSSCWGAECGESWYRMMSGDRCKQCNILSSMKADFKLMLWAADAFLKDASIPSPLHYVSFYNWAITVSCKGCNKLMHGIQDALSFHLPSYWSLEYKRNK